MIIISIVILIAVVIVIIISIFSSKFYMYVCLSDITIKISSFFLSVVTVRNKKWGGL